MTEWYRLRCAGLSDSNIRKLLNITKNYNDIKKISEGQLYTIKFTGEDIRILQHAHKISLEYELEKLKHEQINILFIEDINYPEKLKNIAMPPIFMYYRGDINLLSQFSLGVVGTRKATSYGCSVCEKITKGLVAAGITTVSGVAIGIDSICHKRTLDENGKTIGVVGSGLDVIYPKENEILWHKIAKYGLLLSEYALGTPPHTYNFPMRNRIIVGISDGIVIVESRVSGGSLITAQLALEEGRGIFAIPGEIYSETSIGCNNLIKNSQAKLVVSVEDILEDYGVSSCLKDNEIEISLTEIERNIFNSIKNLKTIDEILQESRIKIPEALATLIDLEMKGLIVAVPGGSYRKK